MQNVIYLENNLQIALFLSFISSADQVKVRLSTTIVEKNYMSHSRVLLLNFSWFYKYTVSNAD